MIGWMMKKIVGSKNQRTVKAMTPLIDQINTFEESYQSLSDEQLQAKTPEFKERIAKGETVDDLLPEAFAVVKNTCRRFTDRQHTFSVRGQEMVWAMIPYDVQIVGGIVLHQGNIAEMATGEGKTLVATMPVYLNSLEGKGLHVVTVNTYLASRDAEWMGEVYRFLGLTVGVIDREQPPDVRREQYNCDITYGTNSEFGFDYLRDNGMAVTKEQQVQRGHHYAIVDEVDSILIDEARTPLIISGPSTVGRGQYDKYKAPIDRLVRAQVAECNQWVNEARKALDEGDTAAGGRLMFKTKLSMPRSTQLMKLLENPDHRRAMDDAELAIYQDMRRIDLYKMKDEALFTIDEKSNEADLSERGREFLNPNDPEMFVLPDLLSSFADIENAEGMDDQAKLAKRQESQSKYDEASERIHNIGQLLRAYCVYEKDVQYVVEDNKVIIVDEFTGRPMPGRRWSDGLHQAIEAKEGVTMEGETQTLATITIQNYFRLYDKLAGMTGTAMTEANEFQDIYKLGVVEIPTNRPVARIDQNDIIYKTKREKHNALMREIKDAHEHGQPILVGTVSVESSEDIGRMLKRENIVHNVLNAKFHQQEAEIVSLAGQKGAVTIATNMAGRGTDIKLGEGVRELGGLYVIATERHEARRIDRQLRGRCARQGDPGMSKFFISFEDDLMRHFGDSRRISSLMTKLGMKDDEELEHPWLNKSVETAQKRVEQRNYQARKHTLQYDDVMNQQREVIYDYRNEILTTEDTRKEVFDVIEEVVQNEAELRLGEGEGDRESYLNWVNLTFPLGLPEDALPWEEGFEAVAAKTVERVRTAYDVKIQFEQPEAVQHLERAIVLGAIDRLWQEHLYAMDGLRSSIHLRSIGQKDPLIEYKREAYSMFEEMMGNVKAEIVNGVFRSASSLEAFENFLRHLPQQLVKEDAPSAMSGMAPQGQTNFTTTGPNDAPPEQAPKKEIRLPIRRDTPKHKPNDPEPCGSGRKYKKLPDPELNVPIPASYEAWSMTLASVVGIELKPGFIDERLKELNNPKNKATQHYYELYGREHLDQVISWFQRAKEEASAGAGK